MDTVYTYCIFIHLREPGEPLEIYLSAEKLTAITAGEAQRSGQIASSISRKVKGFNEQSFGGKHTTLSNCIWYKIYL